MKNEEIYSVRTYQSVPFEKSQHTFFCTESSNKRPPVTFEIVTGIGVLIESKKDRAVIPFANISAINLDTKAKKEERDDLKNDIAKPAKSQKAAKVKVDPAGAKRF